MMSGDASRAVDQPTFDIADRLGTRLMLLGRMCGEGNGYAAWLAYRLCRAEGRAFPDWLTAYLDEAATFLLDEYHRDEKRDRRIEFALGLNAPQEHRAEAMRAKSTWQSMQIAVEALLPSVVDDYAKQHGLPTQTAIKRLAPSFGYSAEQWTRLRDAYKREKQRKSDNVSNCGP